LLSVQTINAQQTELSFERISIEQGLSQSTVHSIIQDKTGFIWIATEDGLNRYDGHGFIVYRNERDNKTSISNNQVRALLQDKNGTIWAGTGNGLSALNLMYDDKSKINKEGFYNFFNNQEDTLSLCDNNIRCLFEDKDGDIWIGTTGGLNKIVNNSKNNNDENYLTKIKFTQSFFNDRFNKLITKEFISSITEDGNGNLWFGTMGKGVIVYNRKTGTVNNYKNEEGNPGSIGSNYVIKLFTDFSGRVWIGTYGGGLNRFDHITKKFVRYIYDSNNSNSLSENKIYDIVDDNNGNIWIGTFSGGLNKLSIKTNVVTRYINNNQNPFSISNDFIRCLLIDRSKNLWAGTNNGINKTDLKPPKFISFKNNLWDKYSLSDNFVLSIFEDKNKNLWLGTNNGLHKYDPNTNGFVHQKIPHNNPRSKEGFVYSIIQDEQGYIWLGTFGGGLIKCDRDGKIIKQYLQDDKNKNSIVDNRINNLFLENNGDIIVGTVAGVCVLQKRDDKFRRFLVSAKDSSLLADKSIEKIITDKNKIYWLATDNGLISVDPADGNVMIYLSDEEKSESISSNTINTICEDQQGNLWVGTENGLNKLDRKTNTFSVFTTKNGLPNNYINSVIDDESGNIWIATNRGISKLAVDLQEGKQFRNYDTDDGLQGYEFNINSVLRTSNGEIYFGGTNGLTKINPSQIKDNSKIPDIAITSFQVANKQLLSFLQIIKTDKIILSYNENIFSFEFTAFDYTNPKKNLYAYKLEGFDKDWIQNGNNRFANYTNIDPGEYTFLVKASNSDGVWNHNYTSIKLLIKPPFYKTWYAYLIYVLIGLIIFYYLRKYELNKRKIKNEMILKEEKEKANLIEIQLRAEKAELQTKALESEKELDKQIMRARIASDLHDEIGSNLSSITLLSSIINNDTLVNSELKKQILSINLAAKSSTESIRDIIWFINPTSDKLNSLFSRIKETTNFMLAGIDYKIKVNEVKNEEKINPELKRNLYLIYKEALNNIIKHSSAKSANIDFKINDSNLNIVIEDDGRGFDQNNIKEGNGLRNIKNRAEQIGGTLEIISTPGKGTKIILEVSIT
jgi:ligand-binding sensor domain-containing protein/signal transduction histidine kinase